MARKKGKYHIGKLILKKVVLRNSSSFTIHNRGLLDAGELYATLHFLNPDNPKKIARLLSLFMVAASKSAGLCDTELAEKAQLDKGMLSRLRNERHETGAGKCILLLIAIAHACKLSLSIKATPQDGLQSKEKIIRFGAAASEIIIPTKDNTALMSLSTTELSGLMKHLRGEMLQPQLATLLAINKTVVSSEENPNRGIPFLPTILRRAKVMKFTISLQLHKPRLPASHKQLRSMSTTTAT